MILTGQRLFIALLILTFLFSGYQISWGSDDEDIRTLEMFAGEKYPDVAATRNARPISQIAENVTVLTADDIKALHAHSVSEVLATVPGVTVDLYGSPGSLSTAQIQGSKPQHVLVLIDGVSLNTLAEGVSDLGAIPVQNIDRIEIVKGPASSTWGAALGGVINIITKSPDPDRVAGGTVTASFGERMTADVSGDLSGTVGKTGYYLFASHLRSDGLTSGTSVNNLNFSGKLTQKLSSKGGLLFAINYQEGSRGDFASQSLGFSSSLDHHYLTSSLSLRQEIIRNLNLDLSVRGSWKDLRVFLNRYDSGLEVARAVGSESAIGTSAKVTFREGIQNLAFGIDFDHGSLNQTSGVILALSSKQNVDRLGIYLSDTLSLGDFAVTPGFRYDRNNVYGEFFSPSIGVTWNPTELTTLRLYGGRGFSLPALAIGDDAERVWSLQAGIETTQIPYVWLKGTYFHNYTWDINQFDLASFSYVKHKQLRQGGELELRTVPVLHTSLSLGYMYLDATDDSTGARLKGIPPHTLNVGLLYNDRKSQRGSLIGRYIDWNGRSSDHGKYSAMIWDLHLARTIFSQKDTKFEIFFSVWNLFNGSQYQVDRYQNARRWIEGGISAAF